MISTGNLTMLYCPKCRRTYKDGTQRFCESDGGRLLPAPSAQKNAPNNGGVFSNLLGKNDTNNPETQTSAPPFIPFNKTEEAGKKLTSFPSSGRIFQSEQFLKPKVQKTREVEPEGEDSILELEPPIKPETKKSVLEFEPIPPVEKDLPPVQTAAFEITPENLPETSADTSKPAPRLVKPEEIASGTADVGNRKTHPVGRAAFSFENTAALLGQTVKGRYQIIEELEPDDEDSVIYLAEDQIFAGKNMIVRVFASDDFVADAANEKLLIEERVSLSHLNHPNIAGVFDSGELPEGNEFIVSEFVEGASVAEIMRNDGEFNALRTARIIRQTSYALSEAHQNGILHRNLKPENIVLTVSDAGIEQVKLMNFGVSRGEITDSNFLYKAPEEIESGISTYASDIYALGTIGYQMLTARLPFDVDSETALLKAQKKGLTELPTKLRADLQPLADKILEKALAANPSERYPKARDFGDAFFNAMTTVAPWSKEDEKAKIPTEKNVTKSEFQIVQPITARENVVEESSLEADIHISPGSVSKATELSEVKATEDLAWEKRSPEPPKNGSFWQGWLVIAGVIVLLFVFWGISRMIVNRSNQQPVVQPQIEKNTNVAPVENQAANIIPAVEPDIAPEPRLQTTPQGSQRFQNTRDNLSEGLAKNFLGFEIFYPQDWTKKQTDTNYLDISKRASNGFPIEQMLITRYDSRGSMTLDRPNFSKFVVKSNEDLKKSLGSSFKVISEGESAIQNGRWRAYEIKFQSTGESEKGVKATVWGRRLWIPVQRAGEQNGFVITMLATSLSGEVKGIEDVGIKGDLANVLETFEPEQYR